MIVLNDVIQTDALATGANVRNRRSYRSRNLITAEAGAYGTPPLNAPEDSPFWSEIIAFSCRAGVRAIQTSLPPAILVWSIMGALALLYFTVPASQSFFSALTALKIRMGILFPFLGMGLSVGILAELLKVIVSRNKRWTAANTVNALFNIGMFGVLGVFTDYFYALQSSLFGSGNSFRVLASKVIVDQFIWTVFFANPFQTILYLWKNNDYSLSKVVSQMTPLKTFWGMSILPVLITNWAFWIPMVSIIYSFPTPLQLPLAILAVTIWVILLTILTEKTNETN
ncbi:MAG: hypothetical protein ACQKBT_11155 [Puniceicoccales bacterium]